MTDDIPRSALQGVVAVRARGELDGAAVRRILADLAADDSLRGRTRMLLDLRAAQCQLSLVDLYELAGGLARHRDAFSGRIAVVVSGAVDLEQARFLELCASNRGLRMAAFVDLGEAESWLDSGRAA